MLRPGNPFSTTPRLSGLSTNSLPERLSLRAYCFRGRLRPPQAIRRARRRIVESAAPGRAGRMAGTLAPSSRRGARNLFAFVSDEFVRAIAVVHHPCPRLGPVRDAIGRRRLAAGPYTACRPGPGPRRAGLRAVPTFFVASPANADHSLPPCIGTRNGSRPRIAEVLRILRKPR